MTIVGSVNSRYFVNEEVDSCGSSSSDCGACYTLKEHAMNDPQRRCYAQCQNGVSYRVVKLVVLYRVDAKTAREGFKLKS